MSSISRRGPRWTAGALAALALVWAGGLAGPLYAQDGAGGSSAGGGGTGSAPLTVSSNVEDVLARDAAVELTFNRPPVRPAERIAVFIDRTDVTGLFRTTEQGLSYERGMILLPQGEHELVVYRVDGLTGEWEELLREPFQTLGRFGFQPGTVDPSVTASWATRLDEGFDPESAAPAPADENVDIQIRLSTEHVRRNLTLSSQAALVGATRRESALRFRQEGEDAPKLDLSTYHLEAAGGPVSFSVGHLSSGGQRHLVNNFAARGASLSVRPSDRVDLAFSAQNGSNEVGWSNILGMEESDHRVLTGSLGLEAFDTPGALRLEVTGMQGSVVPRAGFNQGVVNDAEESRGVAVRLTAAALDRRLRLDAGYATSAFDNPEDPLLNQGLELVEVTEETSGARYLEASLDALRNLSLGGSRTARLTLGVRHERVDPLYRSLGAYAQADRMNNQVDLRADVAGVSLQGSYAESRNNLGEIVSILTTHTERSQVNLGLPVARVVGVNARWLPSLQLRVDRTHQFGEGVPENGGFDPSHVPDQVSLNRTAQADWRLGKVTLGLQWNRSEQDNRQPGREDADLNVTRQGVNVRMSPLRSLNLNLDLTQETSENLQRDETDETLRWGAQMNWQVFARSSLSVRVSDTATEDLLVTRRRANRQVNAQWSSVLPYLDRIQGQYFLRYNRNENSSFNATFDQDDRREAWWLDLGLNFTFF